MSTVTDNALELLAYIDRSGGQVWLEGERVRYRLPDGHGATLERLAAARDAVREALRSRAVEVARPAQTPTRSAAPTMAAQLESLPLELQALIRAAGAGTLPKGAVTLEGGITYDLERYVLGFAAQYLTGDQVHALRNLRAALLAWQAQRGTVSA